MPLSLLYLTNKVLVIVTDQQEMESQCWSDSQSDEDSDTEECLYGIQVNKHNNYLSMTHD